MLPLTDGAVDVLRLTSGSVPSDAVFLTVNAPFARLATGHRASSKVILSLSRLTSAEEKTGPVVSTGMPRMAIIKELALVAQFWVASTFLFRELSAMPHSGALPESSASLAVLRTS